MNESIFCRRWGSVCWAIFFSDYISLGKKKRWDAKVEDLLDLSSVQRALNSLLHAVSFNLHIYSRLSCELFDDLTWALFFNIKGSDQLYVEYFDPDLDEFVELDQVDLLPKEKGKIRVQPVANNNNGTTNNNNSAPTSTPNPSEKEEAEEPDDPNDPSN